MTQGSRVAGDAPARQRTAERLEQVAWALCLIMTGTLWLAPAGWAPEGTWLAGLGLILLGLNAARHLLGLRANGFGIAIGLVASAAGAGRILGRDLHLVPILLIAVGAGMIVQVLARWRHRDGAASAS